MAQYVPHYRDWKTVERWRKAASISFYVGVLFSILNGLEDYNGFVKLKQQYPSAILIFDELLEALTILSLIIYPLIDAYIEFVLAPGAEEKRKADFLDNAFGSHILVDNSVGYYTNDSLSPGIYKAAVNLFENAFFTYRVTKAMAFKKAVPSAIIVLVVIIMAFFGWSRQPLAIPMLQLLFSSAIAIDFIKFCILRSKVKNIYEGWCLLFRSSKISENPADQITEILRYWLMYETTLSRLQIGLDSTIFDRLNKSLTSEWQTIKNNLNIK